MTPRLFSCFFQESFVIALKLGILGVELTGLAVLRQCRLPVALVFKGQTKAMMGCPIGRIEP
jgi:hypothetical protein